MGKPKQFTKRSSKSKYQTLKHFKGLKKNTKIVRRDFSNIPQNWKELYFNAQKSVKNDDLLFYARLGNRKLVKYALMFGTNNADINYVNDGENALTLAVMSKNIPTIEFLLKNGINVNYLNKDKLSALHIACMLNNNNIAKLLIKYGADANIVGRFKETPIFEATKNNNADMILDLVSNGATIHQKNNNGKTPFFIACQNGSRAKTMKLLIMLNEEEKYLKTIEYVNLKDDFGDTPLITALKGKGTNEMAKILIEKGADINSKNKQHISPLMVAAKQGKTDMVKYLMLLGANYKSKDNTKQTANDYAKKYNRHNCEVLIPDIIEEKAF